MAVLFSLLPALAGLALSVWRFRAGDSLVALGAALAGVALTVLVATRMPERRL